MQSIEQLLSGELLGSKHLKISCGLTAFPDEIFSLSESLEILDLSGNKLTSLPNDFWRLKKLKIAFFSDNLFKAFPAVLSDCEQLEMIGFKSNQIEIVPENSLPKNTRWLILTNNKIKKLPASIGNCLLLQKVALAGNQLQELPDEMANCKNLELLRISANRLTEIPDWLMFMPKLAWLAFAGNLFSKRPPQLIKPHVLNWLDFELKEQLGEGASGHIYKALWKNDKVEKEVAIKIFKGEVTSDGFPEDEMQACIAAGKHTNLVGLIGEIKNHPKNKQGLVMELIPASYYNLGLPPSFTTCSRDTFAEGTRFKIQQILKIASDIASASLHLHMRGLMHGDLYAHNILIDRFSTSLMGDYGAASFYEREDVQFRELEKIEVRAFACLLDDLLGLLIDEDSTKPLVEIIKQLRDDCMSDSVIQRPFFEEIVFRLEKES